MKHIPKIIVLLACVAAGAVGVAVAIAAVNSTTVTGNNLICKANGVVVPCQATTSLADGKAINISAHKNTSTTTTTTTTSSTSSTSTTSNGAYQLPADRTYDWNPGLNAVGGIPDANWAVYRTISPSGGDDTATIQAALDSCPHDGVVKLTAGVFHVSGEGLSLENSYCVLRGAGPGPGNWPVGTAASGTAGTYLEQTQGDLGGSGYPVAIIGPRWQDGPTGNNNGGPPATNLTSDAVRGSKSVTVASTTGLSVGALVIVNETTDTSISHWDSPSDATLGWFEEANRPVGDVMEIAAISGNTLTFTTDFPISYQVSKSAHLYLATHQTNFSGIEDLYAYGGEGGDGGGGIHLFNCDHCWIKHIEDTWTDGAAVHVDQSFGTEIRDSYFHDAVNGYSSGGCCYGIGINWYSSGSLVENNIIIRYDKVDVMRSAGGGNVFGYNYLDDGCDGCVNGQNNAADFLEDNLNSSHMTTPHYELFEGNQAPNFDQDNRWGNSDFITVFRNQFTGELRDFDTGPNRGIGVTQWHWNQSFVGNVLGTSTDAGIFTDGYEYAGGSGNPNVVWDVCYTTNADTTPDGGKCLATQLRDGNYDYVSKKVHWYGIGGTGVNNGLTPPQNATLPASMYLSSAPAFFGSSAWPWVDGSNGSNPLPGTLPARARYDAGTPNGG